MVRNIIYTVIFAVIVTLSWQVGSILLEKKDIAYLLEEHANSIKQFGTNVERIKTSLANDLKQEGLPTEFTIEKLEEEGNRTKIRISYRYKRVASVFGYTYYQMDENITAETETTY